MKRWLPLLLLVFFGICSVLTIKYVLLKVRVAYAFGHVAIFEDIKANAWEMNNPADLSGLLEYTVKYGTGPQQVPGSHLHAIVEIARSNAIATIIARLRVVTGNDYGDNVAIWLNHYPPPRP